MPVCAPGVHACVRACTQNLTPQVSKDAVWFSSVEAEDGQHVLLVTDDAKKAKKYGLPALEGEAFALELPGKVRMGTARRRDGSIQDGAAVPRTPVSRAAPCRAAPLGVDLLHLLASEPARDLTLCSCVCACKCTNANAQTQASCFMRAAACPCRR